MKACTGCQTSAHACTACDAIANIGLSSVGAPLSNAQARQIIQQAWQLELGRPPTQSELNYTQAIALFETGYGRVGQFARFVADGMFNWGALQRPRTVDGTCPAGSTPGSDSGNARCFLVFPDDVAAARRYIWELTQNPNHASRVAATLRAMGSGTPDDVAAAMKIAPAWYEAPVATYAQAIRNGLRNIGASTAVSTSTAKATPSRSILMPLLVGGALGYGAWWVYKIGRD